MRKIYFILVALMFACLGCEWRMRSDVTSYDANSFVLRYDRMESFFLTSGDFSALQQMQTHYPLQTRLLIENLLQLGKVEDAHINTIFYSYYQDTTLQRVISDVGRQYARMDDLDHQLKTAFERLSRMLPNVPVPLVYTQIGSFDQSIVVGDSVVGISLDKYLGKDYPYYVHYGYSERQRSMMTRDFIAPDCLSFYLLSLYPVPSDSLRQQHMGNIQYVVNTALRRLVFRNEYVSRANELMLAGGHISYDQLLRGKW